VKTRARLSLAAACIPPEVQRTVLPDSDQAKRGAAFKLALERSVPMFGLYGAILAVNDQLAAGLAGELLSEPQGGAFVGV
jgi:hypothetical protein